MKRSSFTRVSAGVLGIGLVLAACGTDNSSSAPGNDGTSDATPVVLDYATYVPRSAVHSQVILAWADRVEELTDGGVAFNFHFDGSLLGVNEMLDGLGDGRADMGFLPPAVFPGQLPLSQVPSLPFITADVGAHQRAVNALLEESPELQAEYHAANTHTLFSTATGPNVMVSDHPVDALEDLQGLGIRGFGYVINAVDLGGGNAVSVAAVESYEAMERGVIDVVSGLALDNMVDWGFHEITDYLVDPGLGIFGYSMQVMNKEVYDSLPGEWQDALATATAEVPDMFIDLQIAYEDEACNVYKEAGGTVTAWDDSETAAWEERARQPIWDAWKDSAMSAGVDENSAEHVLERFVALVGEHEEGSSYTPPAQRCGNEPT